MRSCSGARWPWSLQVLRQSHRDKSSNDISHVAQGPKVCGGQGGHENPGGFGGQGFLECSMIQRQKLLSYIDMNFLGRIGRCFQAIGRDFFQGLG